MLIEGKLCPVMTRDGVDYRCNRGCAAFVEVEKLMYNPGFDSNCMDLSSPSSRMFLEEPARLQSCMMMPGRCE